jgi:hypothetical protein
MLLTARSVIVRMTKTLIFLTFLSTFLFSPFLARLSYAQTQTPATPVVATRTFGREATAGDSAATTNTLRNHAQ